MTTEWDGTPWGGTAVAKASDTGWGLGPGAAQVAKAATGWEQFAYSGASMISSVSRSPLKRMREEQALYWTHPWVRVAERAVTRRVAGLPWHLESGDDEVQDETTNPELKVIRGLLEKPQAALPARDRQPGIDSWANLVSITSRHLGLCGLTHWYPDQPDANGQPAAILYINPARMYPLTTTSGQLVAWSLDPKDDHGNGGQILSRDEVMTFYLEPPDWGGLSTGLVHAAWLKAQITQYGDRHFLDTLDSGGRLAGLVAPKEGTMGDDQYKVASLELRSAQEAPDASKRLTILRGPIEYHRTTGTSQELDLSAYAEMTRSDILTVWGVPDSQEGIPMPTGLNSGGTKGYDEAILYQGSVHDRVRVIGDVAQFQLLDRYVVSGTSPQLVIEEPAFDDKTPQFELAKTAESQPLTRNQRLDILGYDPLPEYGPDGEPLGLAIDLPFSLRVAGQGPQSDKPQPPGNFGNAPQPEPVVLPNPTPLLEAVNPPAKAGPLQRETLTRRFEPAIRKAVASFLREQKAALASTVRDKGEHIARKPTDRTWFDIKRWDRELMDAVKQGIAGVAMSVTAKVQATMAPAKADPFTDRIVLLVLSKVAERITGINRTTRDAIAALIGEAFDRGLSPREVGDLIEDATTFDEARAELVARTETALAYNEAALTSYSEFGVDEVEAIDGDEDEECAARNGQTFSLEEAMSIEDHPNGTLDWVPIVNAKAAPPPRMVIERDQDGRIVAFSRSAA